MPSGPSLPRTVADNHERWRWDLNPRTGYPVTRFRVLRTHVQARSPASATCSTRPSAGVTEPPRTTTNETRTETRSAVAPSAGLGPQRPTLLDESALHECHESRGTRYCERHSAHKDAAVPWADCWTSTSTRSC